jgi:hypothetical protein
MVVLVGRISWVPVLSAVTRHFHYSLTITTLSHSPPPPSDGRHPYFFGDVDDVVGSPWFGQRVGESG